MIFKKFPDDYFLAQENYLNLTFGQFWRKVHNQASWAEILFYSGTWFMLATIAAFMYMRWNDTAAWISVALVSVVLVFMLFYVFVIRYRFVSSLLLPLITSIRSHHFFSL